jgi:uncharacterized protein YbaA (DUF1428 family)
VDYKECAGDDLAAKWGTPFTHTMNLKRGETAIFAYIVFKSRAHRDRVNARVMKEMAAMAGSSKDMPFDPKRMVFGASRRSSSDDSSRSYFLTIVVVNGPFAISATIVSPRPPS